MKKIMITISICFMGLLSFVNAQTCDCLPLLENTITKVENHFQYQSKNISKEKLEYLRWLNRFKILATQPHSKEDCHNLIEDYLSILEDQLFTKQFHFKKGKIT